MGQRRCERAPLGDRNPDGGHEEPGADQHQALAKLVKLCWSGSAALVLLSPGLPEAVPAKPFAESVGELDARERKVCRTAAKAMFTPYLTRYSNPGTLISPNSNMTLNRR